MSVALLPRDFPPWEPVAGGFDGLQSGTFERLNAALRELLRVKREVGVPLPVRASPTPSRPRPPGSARGEHEGYDGNKKVRGRKRRILVDTEGLVLNAKVHSAKVPDQDGLRLLLGSAPSGLSRLRHLWLDAGYQGRGKRSTRKAWA